MLRSRLAALLLLPVAFMLKGAKAVLVDPEPVSVPTGIAAADVAKAIKVGIVRRGWVVTRDESGLIEATLNIRTHMAKVNIPYSTKEVAIHYVASDNLDYQEKNGVKYIHGNYIKWVRNIQSDIQRELQLLTVK
jgi:hypothetical protein